MFDSARILEPLDEERDRLARLEGYRSADELAQALATAADAVEQSLRRLLRNDGAAPDELRLVALSAEQLPYDRLIPALTKSDRISLALAGRAHELRQTAERAASSEPRAVDADIARATLDQLRREVAALEAAERGEAEAATERQVAGAEAAPAAMTDASNSAEVVVVPNARPHGRRRWFVGAALILLLVAVWVAWPRGAGSMAAGIAAFPDRPDVAEREFLTVLDAEPGNVTARLYLGRIYRRQARFEDAANMLSAAAAAAPADADVRRELGYLFLDLGRPSPAAAEFRKAQQADPEDKLNWIGLIRALRAAGDPEAEVVLSRAPADVRAAFSPAPGTD